MSFWISSLHGLSQNDIESLIAEKAEEGLRLEFKRLTALSTRDEKREAAKDFAAMANASGGRIVYGIAEAPHADGPIASQVTPLADATLPSRYADVIHGSVTPRPRFDIVSVPIASGGFVMVVEVPPPLFGDLYLVTGYGEYRYYRRGPTGAVLMTESDIREGYARGAAIRAQLELEIKEVGNREHALRQHAEESILVIPWHLRAGMIEPASMPSSLGAYLAEHGLQHSDARDAFLAVRLQHDGYVITRPYEAAEASAPFLCAIRKNGVVHSSLSVVSGPSEFGTTWFPVNAIQRILEAMAVAHDVHTLSSYWGPVRLEYRLHIREPWSIGGSWGHGQPLIAAGVQVGTTDHVDLGALAGNWGGAVKGMLDSIFHAGNRPACPQFTADGQYIHRGSGYSATQILERIRRWVRVAI